MLLSLLIALGGLPSLCLGAGLIVVTEPGALPASSLPDPARHSFAPLEISSLQVRAKVRDQLAETTIEQEFYNPNARQLEGTFLFPVPKGAQLKKFAMSIGGKDMEAELLSSDKARRIYEDIVRRAKDPALMEYAGRDLYKVRIFPIEPHVRKRITLRYDQLLKSDAGLSSYAVPLSSARFSAEPIKNVSVRIDLETTRPLKSIYSPSHAASIRREGAQKAIVEHEAHNARPESDFSLLYSAEKSDVAANLMTWRQAGEEEGYFVLLASPGLSGAEAEIAAKDVVFVVDTSGSMAGAKLEQAKKALLFCVENLNEKDRFEIIRFSSESEALFEKLAESSSENRKRAREFVGGLKTLGGTAIVDALHKALSLPRENKDRPFVVIFLTDGRPTVGETDEDKIVARVKKTAEGSVRVFCFGIGTDVNAHLLDKITESTRAVSQYVLPEEDIEVKVSSFFSKINDPVLVDIELDFGEAVRISKLSPAPMPDLFKGEQLVVAGRFKGSGSAKLRLEGSLNREKKTFLYDVSFPAESDEKHAFIPRLWATRRVGFLLDELRLRGESAELKEEITELARRYGIVTPFTAYLILEDEALRNVPLQAQSFGRLQQDREARSEAKDLYDNLSVAKSGDAGVSNARFGLALKEASSSSDALAQSAEALQRGFGGVPASSSAPAVRLSPAGRAAASAQAAQGRLLDSARQTKFASGKNFFQNGQQWIDPEVQKMTGAKPVRLKFGSPEYFDFASKNAKAAPWLALGQNIQFVMDGAIYEIHE